MEAPSIAPVDPLELWERGDRPAAVAAQRDRLRSVVDLELLNDLAVMEAATGRRGHARAVLHTALAIDPEREDLAENLQAIDQDFIPAFLAGIGHYAGDQRPDDTADIRPDYISDPLPTMHDCIGRTLQYLVQAPALEQLYASLDGPSRETMLRVLLFRALEREHVPAPLDPDAYRAAIAQARSMIVERDVARSDFCGWALDRFDLRPIGLPLQVVSHEVGIATFFLLGQYRLERSDVFVGVQPGDVVIDGGACWGDTAVYFAHLAGPTGRVVAFEFDPANDDICRRNLALNPELADRVEIVPCALWDRGGQQLGYAPDGYGTTVALNPGSGAFATTASIDEIVAERGLDRVDFIKLDIEGAEVNALEGAANTLRRHRPRLAIAAYHRNDDLTRIPVTLRQMGVNYRFHLAHYTTHHGETVLYAH
jgi:FkbM family methyltransferase